MYLTIRTHLSKVYAPPQSHVRILSMQTSKNAVSVRHEPKGSRERRQSILERRKMTSAGTEPALHITDMWKPRRHSQLRVLEMPVSTVWLLESEQYAKVFFTPSSIKSSLFSTQNPSPLWQRARAFLTMFPKLTDVRESLPFLLILRLSCSLDTNSLGCGHIHFCAFFPLPASAKNSLKSRDPLGPDSLKLALGVSRDGVPTQDSGSFPYCHLQTDGFAIFIHFLKVRVSLKP